MGKKDLIEKEAEKTLQAIEGIGRPETNPFLYGKIIHGLEEIKTVEKKFSFRFALSVVVICILANLSVMFFDTGNSDSADYGSYNSDSVRTARIKSFATEYSSINNFYFY